MSTPFPSQMTGAQIENALNKVNGLIAAANNGKILCVDNGSLAAKSAIEIQGGTIDALNVTANGTYNHAALGGYSPVVVNVPTSGVMTQLSVTANGMYTPSAGVDGFNSVTVNVSGGGIGIVKSVIKAVYPVGQICTCSKDGTTYTSDTSGIYMFCLPSYGTYTLTSGQSEIQCTTEENSFTTAYIGPDTLKAVCLQTNFARLSTAINDVAKENNWDRYITRNTNEPVLFLCGRGGGYGGYVIVSLNSDFNYTASQLGSLNTPHPVIVNNKTLYVSRMGAAASGTGDVYFTTDSVEFNANEDTYIDWSDWTAKGTYATELNSILSMYSSL